MSSGKLIYVVLRQTDTHIHEPSTDPVAAAAAAADCGTQGKQASAVLRGTEEQIRFIQGVSFRLVTQHIYA